MDEAQIKSILARLRLAPSYCLNRDEARLRSDAADVIEALAERMNENSGRPTDSGN